jgi:putative MATE family efflux protein
MQTASAEESKFLKMTETPVERLVIQMAVPTIVIMMISALYNMADTYFVGSLGTSATAAIGVVFPLMAIIQAMGFFFGQGSGNYISRQLGAHHIEQAEKMAALGFFSAIICGILFSVAGFIFIKPLGHILGSTETILPYAIEYMRFILIGAPWMIGSLVLNNQLRFQGSAVYGMIGMVSGAFLNVILDPIFIFVLNMGVGGAALATIISQFVGCVILLIGCSREGNISILPKNFVPSRERYKELVKGGLPSLIRQSLNSTSTIIINHFAGFYGDAAIASISIVTRVCMMANSALMGFGQGFQPVCGFNYGAGRFDRVKKAFWFCVKAASIILIIIAAVLFIKAPAVIELFRKDPDVIRIGTLSLRLQCISLPFTGWMILTNMMLQTIGKTFQANILAFSRQGLFLIPLLIIFSSAFGLLGIQLSQPIADITTSFLAVFLSIKVLKELKETNKSAKISEITEDMV